MSRGGFGPSCEDCGPGCALGTPRVQRGTLVAEVAQNRPKQDRPVVAPPASLTLTIAARTRDKLGEMSPGETKVARALLATYPLAGLETAAEFARRAKVSAPTVLRFAACLGFDGYPAFQKALMREVHEEMGSPLRRIADERQPSTGDGGIAGAAASFQDVLSSTFQAIPEAELSRAVAMLSDSKLRIHLIGGRFSRLLASYLTAHLVLVRQGVRMVPADGPERTSSLLDMGRHDVLVAFDYRRYDTGVVEFAARASAQGAHVILFTDPWMSPAAEVAEVVVPSRVEAPSPFDSMVPAMAVVEILIAAVAEHLGSSARDRLAGIEAMQPSDSRRND